MSILIGKYPFCGPYISTHELDNWSGVYVILNEKGWKEYIIDVDESAKVKSAIETHRRKECWKENRKGSLAYAVYWTPGWEDSERKAMEQEVRREHDVPCGEN